MAARTISHVLSLRGGPDVLHPKTYKLDPVSAKSMLTSILHDDLARRPEILEAGICYLIGLPFTWSWSHTGNPESKLLLCLGTISAVSTLERALQQDTALFVEERQNLYVDEVQEAEIWISVMTGAERTSLSRTVASKLEEWTLGGIELLTIHAQHHYDGPLGWSAKREVFVAGMRVLLAAELLVCWQAKQGLDSDGAKAQLRRLRDVGRERGLNEHWMEKLGYVLAVEP